MAGSSEHGNETFGHEYKGFRGGDVLRRGLLGCDAV
jgi:hypothetical protein